MKRLHEYSSPLLLAIIFLLMVALAVSIEITGSSIAGRILVVLIPFSAVVLGVISKIEAKSTVESVPAIVLVFSGIVATALAVLGAGPFSNLLVDVALIGGVFGIRYTKVLQTTVQTAQRAFD